MEVEEEALWKGGNVKDDKFRAGQRRKGCNRDVFVLAPSDKGVQAIIDHATYSTFLLCS